MCLSTGIRIRETEKILQIYLIFEKKLIKKGQLHFSKKIIRLQNRTAKMKYSRVIIK